MNQNYMMALQDLLDQVTAAARRRSHSGLALDGTGFNTYSPDRHPLDIAQQEDAMGNPVRFQSRAGSVANNRALADMPRTAWINNPHSGRGTVSTWAPDIHPMWTDDGADKDSYPSRAGYNAGRRSMAPFMRGQRT